MLVSRGPGGGWRTRVADFGSGWMAETARLEALRITDPGFGRPEGLDVRSLSGTLMYLAPEVLAGQAPTAAADVFALGVMLYQMVVGDFRRPLTAGWEADIADPLLREDIAEAAAGDPARRLKGVAELAERLAGLEGRRAERDRLEQAQQRLALAERNLQQTRARRPWVVASLVLLLIGAGASTTLYARAAQDRDHARRQTAIAEAISQFLAVDLLSRANPFKNGAPDESLVGAVEAVSPDIDRRFKREPLVAARLHQSIARALDRRSDWTGARREYDRATWFFTLADGPASQDAIIVQLQRAMMEARSYEQDSLPRAKAMLAEQEPRIAGLEQPRPDVAVWLASARGMIALIGDDAATAARQFKDASDRADSMPSFDQTTRLTFKQRLAFSHIRMGDGRTAEALFRGLIRDYAALEGADSPNVLMVRLNLAQALMIQGDHQAAINEANAVYPAFLTKLGQTHELTLQLLSTRAQSEGTLMRWDDAIRDDLAVHAIAVAKQGPKSFFAVASLADVATAQCRSDRLVEGLGNAEQAFRAATAAFGERAALTQATGFTWAGCLIAAGRLPQADQLLKPVDAAAVAQLAGDADWGANLALAHAQIAFKRKDYAGARIVLALEGDLGVGEGQIGAPVRIPRQLRHGGDLVLALDRCAAGQTPGAPGVQARLQPLQPAGQAGHYRIGGEADGGGDDQQDAQDVRPAAAHPAVPDDPQAAVVRQSHAPGAEHVGMDRREERFPVTGGRDGRSARVSQQHLAPCCGRQARQRCIDLGARCVPVRQQGSQRRAWLGHGGGHGLLGQVMPRHRRQHGDQDQAAKQGQIDLPEQAAPDDRDHLQPWSCTRANR